MHWESYQKKQLHVFDDINLSFFPLFQTSFRMTQSTTLIVLFWPPIRRRPMRLPPIGPTRRPVSVITVPTSTWASALIHNSISTGHYSVSLFVHQFDFWLIDWLIDWLHKNVSVSRKQKALSPKQINGPVGATAVPECFNSINFRLLQNHLEVPLVLCAGKRLPRNRRKQWHSQTKHSISGQIDVHNASVILSLRYFTFVMPWRMVTLKSGHPEEWSPWRVVIMNQFCTLMFLYCAFLQAEFDW